MRAQIAAATFPAPPSQSASDKLRALQPSHSSVCIASASATNHPNCVIYSMEIGGAGQSASSFDFEREVLRLREAAELYFLDPSVSEWPELRVDHDTEVSSRAHFLPYKIGAIDIDAAYPSLQRIMQELGHPFVDILTISINGSALAALTTGIESSFQGQPLPFGQMQIEIHIDSGADYTETSLNSTNGGPSSTRRACARSGTESSMCLTRMRRSRGRGRLFNGLS
ncbi:Lactoylglutathione lyase [Mycena sanguinolenta]|uniref:Lactoylglutathione lyase n=1 Tax=Mycena sanguinolenta TaxID=230812 RepID=A0A8H6ZB06_9AGAR|nr:Lactoylglutathione lyase [Mycena sanguinolenta]